MIYENWDKRGRENEKKKRSRNEKTRCEDETMMHLGAERIGCEDVTMRCVNVKVNHEVS